MSFIVEKHSGQASQETSLPKQAKAEMVLASTASGWPYDPGILKTPPQRNNPICFSFFRLYASRRTKLGPSWRCASTAPLSSTSS